MATLAPIPVDNTLRDDLWLEAFCYADQKTDTRRATHFAAAYADDAIGKDVNSLEDFDTAYAAWSAAN